MINQFVDTAITGRVECEGCAFARTRSGRTSPRRMVRHPRIPVFPSRDCAGAKPPWRIRWMKNSLSACRLYDSTIPRPTTLTALPSLIPKDGRSERDGRKGRRERGESPVIGTGRPAGRPIDRPTNQPTPPLPPPVLSALLVASFPFTLVSLVSGPRCVPRLRPVSRSSQQAARFFNFYSHRRLSSLSHQLFNVCPARICSPVRLTF